MDFNKVILYVLAMVALILLWNPILLLVNTTIYGTGAVATGLLSFFWVVLALTFCLLFYRVIVELLGDF